MLPVDGRCLAALVLASGIYIPHLQGQPAIQAKRIWESSIADDSFEVEYKASAISTKNDATWLVLGRRPALTMTGPQVLALHGIDRNGKELLETPLESLGKTAGIGGPVDQFFDIAGEADGSMALVLASGGQLTIITVDGATGRFLRAKQVGVALTDLLVTRALPTPAGNLLVIGRRGMRPLATKLDASLAVAWEKWGDPGEVSVYLDGVVYNDESFALVGARSSARRASTPASLWLGQFNAEGQGIRSATMPGRFAAIASAANGGCVVVRGTASASGSDFSFISYDRNLKESWNADLAVGIKDFKPFRVSRIPESPAGYLVVGSEKHRLWIAMVEAGSSVVWKGTLGDPTGSAMPNLVWNFGIDPASSVAVVPFTELSVNAKMQQRQAVRVMAFSAR